MRDFAVVMVASEGPLFEQAVSAFNGLSVYGNDLDYHLIAHQSIPENELARLREEERFTVVPWKEIWDLERHEKSESGQKNSGWECRFYRYRYALRIASQYKAIMITDADMFFCNNIMGFFERAASSGKLLMPNNPWGASDEAVDEKGIEMIQGASSPPYHNMPLFVDASKYQTLLEGVYSWGLKEPYGDMSTLYRTLFRSGQRDCIEPTDNDLWVVTDWYKYMMQESTDDQGRPVITTKDGLRVNSVHRRWNMAQVRDKFIGDIKEDDNRERGVNNVGIFWRTIQWLLKNGPTKMVVSAEN